MKSKLGICKVCIAALIGALGATVAVAGEHAHHGHDARGSVRKGEALDVKALPPLRIVSPLAGAQVGPNIKVEFETGADLEQMTMSAKTVGVHLHVDIDGTSLMPTMTELARVGKNRYRYVFDLPLEAGAHVISVYWSDASHKTIESTVSKVNVTVAPNRGKVKP